MLWLFIRLFIILDCFIFIFYNSLLIMQATGMAAISLPNGASSLPPQVLPLLERFERIYLWMDDDVPGQVHNINLLIIPSRLIIILLGRSKEVRTKVRISQVLCCTCKGNS